jgi:phosphatidylserine decarboxylase
MYLLKKRLKKYLGVKNKMRIAQDSKSWIYFFIFLSIIFLVLSLVLIQFNILFIMLLIFSFIFFLIFLFLLLFFRDPNRKIGSGVVACADGKIRSITNLKDEIIGDCICISTFMNLHNVHVNRSPFDGIVDNIKHISGIHLPAFKKESEKNERVITIINTSIGNLKIVQIAGTFARRIVPYISKGDKIKKGDRIGIIRFGSRVDLYLPKNKINKLNIKIGDIVLAGEDSIAEVNG